MDIAQKLLAALNLWLELSEVDPGQKSFTIGGGLSEWTVVKMHRTIKEALELDDTNITGILMLDALSSAYFDSRNFSVSQLLADPVRTTEYVQKAAKLRAMIQSPAFMDQNHAFVGHLLAALKAYDMESIPTVAMARNLHEVGYLRRDALRSIQNLRVDQFLSGEPEPADTVPAYHGWVHQFWNINQLVEAACRMPSGVTLSLIRDPDDLQSYFVFAIRNGGNLFLLSDVPVHAHPLQKYMSRRPERAFGERMYQNWFPYDLLNLKFDDEAKVFFADESRRRALIPQHPQVDRLKQISDLAPAEVLWTIMMFDRIVEKFWHKGHQEVALSYTGAMIREEHPLLDAAKAAQLPVVAYQTLGLAPLTQADMTQERVMPAVGHDGGRPNAWLEARYADKVAPELFNLLDGGANKLYLPPISDGVPKGPARHKNHELALVLPTHVTVLPADDKQLPFWEKEGRYYLRALETTSFGTREELESNRIYLARHNQAKAIQRLADAEFEQRKADIKTWYTERVTQNHDYLLSLAAHGSLRRTFEPTEPGAILHTADGYTYEGKQFNFVRSYTDPENSPAVSCTVYLHTGYYKNKAQCILNDTASSIRVFFQPQTAAHLAELTGCTVSELPDVLQHWCASRDYQGNTNLARIDPMAWHLVDPWCQMDFRIQMHLSKRAMAQIQKQYVTAPASTVLQD